MRYSLLDLAPVPEGSDIPAALANSADLARHAEGWGYHRYWLAEHHNMPGIASAATAVLIAHIASQTSRIRVGSGGVMLPNHAPYMVAEAFGTLASLYGDRIDLGLGRAPGTDMETARALRRGLGQADTFPQDVQELMAYLGPPQPGARVRAFPGQNTQVPVWILGSSLYGAQLAAYFGLPYAFASHFAPDAMEMALDTYRATFRPSPMLDNPYAMIAINVFAADTDAEGHRLRTSMQQAFVRLRTGRPSKLPEPVDRIEDHLEPAVLESVNETLRITAVGSRDSVRARLKDLIDTHRPEEVILSGQIHDHAARLRSFEIASEVMRDLYGTA